MTWKAETDEIHKRRALAKLQVVRHRLVKEIVNAYDARDQARMAKSRKPSGEGKS